MLLHRGKQLHRNGKGTAFRLFPLHMSVQLHYEHSTWSSVHNNSPVNPDEIKVFGQ